MCSHARGSLYLFCPELQPVEKTRHCSMDIQVSAQLKPVGRTDSGTLCICILVCLEMFQIHQSGHTSIPLHLCRERRCKDRKRCGNREGGGVEREGGEVWRGREGGGVEWEGGGGGGGGGGGEVCRSSKSTTPSVRPREKRDDIHSYEVV